MVKFTTEDRVVVDTLSVATEAYDAYTKLLDLGMEIDQLKVVADNMRFASGAIKANGAKWYIENCDPENALGAAINCGLEALTSAKVDASMEGVLTKVWNTIKEWWDKFIEWVKGIFSKHEEQVVASNDAETKKNTQDLAKVPAPVVAEVNKELPKEKVAPAVKKTSTAWSRFKEFLGGKAETIKCLSLAGITGLGKFVASLPGLLRELMTKCNGIIGKFKSAKTKEEYAVAISEARTWCQQAKAQLLEAANKSSVDYIDAEWSEVTNADVGIKSLTDAKQVAGLLTNNNTIYLGCNQASTSVAVINEVKNKLVATESDDDEIKKIKLEAMRCFMYLAQLQQQLLAHSKKLPVVLSEVGKEVSAQPLVLSKKAA